MSESKWYNQAVVLTLLQLGRFLVLFYERDQISTIRIRGTDYPFIKSLCCVSAKVTGDINADDNEFARKEKVSHVVPENATLRILTFLRTILKSGRREVLFLLS